MRGVEERRRRGRGREGRSGVGKRREERGRNWSLIFQNAVEYIDLNVCVTSIVGYVG